MKKTLYLKFILAYVLLALIGIFVIASLGLQLIEDHVTQQYASDLYSEATAFSSSHTDLLTESRSSEASLSQTYAFLKMAATGDGCDIRVIEPDGTVLIDTSKSFSGSSAGTIRGFNYADFGPEYYEVSRFFRQYRENRLNVCVPITSDMTTVGYIAFSLPMTKIEALRDRLLTDLSIVGMVNFGLSFIILILFTVSVYRPLGKITRGAQEFADGNLDYKIDIPANDEMGALAQTMNFMAGELKKTTDYERKFISNVSHDFRSPLTSIKGFSEAMIDGTIPSEKHEHYLKVISGESDRLEKLTHSILELNKMDQDQIMLNYQDFDIHDILRSTAAVFEGTCRKKKISINLILTDQTLFVHADKEKIEQVLYNLLDNAVKFSDKNSQITMETTVRHGKCFVSVKDEGCGIPQKNLTHIWERFYKADASRGKDRSGTGLGLSIVREIIQAHGQTINVVSTENVGTTFTFSLELGSKKAVRKTGGSPDAG